MSASAHGSSRRVGARCAPFVLALLLACCIAGVAHAEEPASRNTVASAQTPSPAVTESPASAAGMIDPLKAGATPVPGAPVIVDGAILFRLQQRVGSISPVERAQLISTRINGLVSNPFLPDVRLDLVDSPGNTDIVAGLSSGGDTEVLITVTDADAAAAGIGRYQLAETWKSALDSAIQSGKARYGVKSMVLAVLEALLALLILFAVVKVTNKVYARLAAALDAGPSENSRFRVLRNLDLYQSGALNRVLRTALRWARVLFWILLVIVIIPVLFSFFPQTQAVAQSVLDYVRQPLVAVWDGVTGYMPDLIFVAVIIFLLWALTRVVNLVFREIEKGTLRISGFDPEWARFTARIVNFLVIAGGGVIVYPYLPASDSAAFKGITVFLGLIFSLSSTSAVSNIVAGIILTYTGGFRVGDVIKLDTVTGEVTAKTLLVTRVRTWKNEIVSLPNSLALNHDVLNYSALARQGGLVLHTEVTIGYNVPWRRVHELMIEAARATPDILSTPAPFVLQTSLNDYHISYELNAYTDQPASIPRIYSGLHQNIQDCFNEAGVEIMSPAYSALRDGNEITVPSSYLPASYEVPSFRVAPGSARVVDSTRTNEEGNHDSRTH